MRRQQLQEIEDKIKKKNTPPGGFVWPSSEGLKTKIDKLMQNNTEEQQKLRAETKKVLERRKEEIAREKRKQEIAEE